jgi:SAM-dependent methyltransferase
LKPLEQHQIEIQRNKDARAAKPLIRKIYSEFYDQIISQLARNVSGLIVEVGAGSGDLKSKVPEAICTDLFPNPWLDLMCDGYALPFRDGTVSNVIALDVFHHLARPVTFINEAARVLARGGRLILFEPYISLVSSVIYTFCHPEPVAWRARIDLAPGRPEEQSYYAAQGNATRLFFGSRDWLPNTVQMVHARARSDFAYVASGGLSKPAFYPESFYPFLRGMDRLCSFIPKLFAARCLVVLERQ